MRNFILLLLPLLLLGCRKEKEPVNFFGASFGDCFEDFRMPFVHSAFAQTENTISCKTSEFGPLRLVAGENNHIVEVALWHTVSTTTPQLILNGSYSGTKLTFGILDKRYRTNSNKLNGAFAFSLERFSDQKFELLEEIIDSTIKIGFLPLSSIPWSTDTVDLKRQKDFIITFYLGSCDGPSAATCSSNVPEQNGTLECTQFLKTYLDDSIRYQINFRFDDITMKSVQSFKLHDGNMSLDFKIPR